MKKKHYIEYILHEDWCHICGKRRMGVISIVYPFNAEHPKMEGNSRYIRICEPCVFLIQEVAGEGGIKYI